jgi:hypothetical protein
VFEAFVKEVRGFKNTARRSRSRFRRPRRRKIQSLSSAATSAAVTSAIAAAVAIAMPIIMTVAIAMSIITGRFRLVGSSFFDDVPAFARRQLQRSLGLPHAMTAKSALAPMGPRPRFPVPEERNALQSAGVRITPNCGSRAIPCRWAWIKTATPVPFRKLPAVGQCSGRCCLRALRGSHVRRVHTKGRPADVAGAISARQSAPYGHPCTHVGLRYQPVWRLRLPHEALSAAIAG